MINTLSTERLGGRDPGGEVCSRPALPVARSHTEAETELTCGLAAGPSLAAFLQPKMSALIRL